MFVAQAKEKEQARPDLDLWPASSTPYYIWLFRLHSMLSNHNNFNFLFIDSFIGHIISDFKYWYQCHQ